MNTIALRFHETGDPQNVIRLESVPVPEVREHEVRVRVLLASINPADLNLIEGSYGIKPALPAVPGNEGVGEVMECGTAVRDLVEGQRVLLPSGMGTWQGIMVLPSSTLQRISCDVPLAQAAMLRVNPPSAWRMLHDFVPLAPGEWLVQNAANSAVGRAAIQIAKAKEWRTANFVRRPELRSELEEIGADLVLPDTKEGFAQFAKETNGAAVRLGLNAVGGDSALCMANALTHSGVLVTYGAMGRQPLRLPNGLLIFKDIAFRGFWLTRWFKSASAASCEAMFAELEAMMIDESLRLAVEKIYPPEDFKEAIARASAGGRRGKILFRFEP